MSIPLSERHTIERAYHDHVVSYDRTDFYAWGALGAADAHAMRLAGDLRGRVVLELGCGSGDNTVRLAQRGALVHATDISGGMVAETRRRAELAGCGGQVFAQQMSAEQLAFASGAFDLVFGHSVLHHTDLSLTRREVARVLRPGGRAVFLEPLAHNPVLNTFRHLTPGRRTPTERPMSLGDLAFFSEPFASLRWGAFYLVALGAFALLPLGSRRLFRAALAAGDAADRALLRRWPGLGRYAWVAVLEVTR